MSASNKLEQASTRLNRNMEDNVVYIESILTLKKHWKVGSDLPPQFRDKPLFAVDFSYKNGIHNLEIYLFED